MKIFTKRNAAIGALATWIARKRLERKLNRLVGHTRGRRRLLLGAGVATSLAVTLGAVLARRSSSGDAQVA